MCEKKVEDVIKKKKIGRKGLRRKDCAERCQICQKKCDGDVKKSEDVPEDTSEKNARKERQKICQKRCHPRNRCQKTDQKMISAGLSKDTANSFFFLFSMRPAHKNSLIGWERSKSTQVFSNLGTAFLASEKTELKWHRIQNWIAKPTANICQKGLRRNIVFSTLRRL